MMAVMMAMMMSMVGSVMLSVETVVIVMGLMTYGPKDIISPMMMPVVPMMMAVVMSVVVPVVMSVMTVVTSGCPEDVSVTFFPVIFFFFL